MKPAAACFLVALAAAGAPAMAQRDGPTDKPRTCSGVADAERAKCLDRLTRAIAQVSSRPQAETGPESSAAPDTWIFSETTSPIDYSPVAIASVIPGGAPDGSGLKLSIACRGGNTSLTLTPPGVLLAGERYTVSYAIGGGSPTTLPAFPAPFGTGMTLGADVVRLLVSLPPQGETSFHIVGLRRTWEGRYALAGLNIARERMAVSCKWPIKPDKARK